MTRVVKYTKPMQSAFVKVRTHLSLLLDSGLHALTHIFSTSLYIATHTQGDALVEQTQKVVLLSQPSKKLCVWQESRMQGVPYGTATCLWLWLGGGVRLCGVVSASCTTNLGSLGSRRGHPQPTRS